VFINPHAALGYYAADGFDAYVETMAPVPPDSHSRRTSFTRGIGGLKTFFTELRNDSLGKRYYLGEWHSHPAGTACPSATDDENQSAISNDDETDCPKSILLLLGGEPSIDPQLGVFVYSRTSARIDLLPVVAQ